MQVIKESGRSDHNAHYITRKSPHTDELLYPASDN